MCICVHVFLRVFTFWLVCSYSITIKLKSINCFSRVIQQSSRGSRDAWWLWSSDTISFSDGSICTYDLGQGFRILIRNSPHMNKPKSIFKRSCDVRVKIQAVSSESEIQACPTRASIGEVARCLFLSLSLFLSFSLSLFLSFSLSLSLSLSLCLSIYLSVCSSLCLFLEQLDVHIGKHA